MGSLSCRKFQYKNFIGAKTTWIFSADGKNATIKAGMFGINTVNSTISIVDEGDGNYKGKGVFGWQKFKLKNDCIVIRNIFLLNEVIEDLKTKNSELNSKNIRLDQANNKIIDENDIVNKLKDLKELKDLDYISNSEYKILFQKYNTILTKEKHINANNLVINDKTTNNQSFNDSHLKKITFNQSDIVKYIKSKDLKDYSAIFDAYTIFKNHGFSDTEELSLILYECAKKQWNEGENNDFYIEYYNRRILESTAYFIEKEIEIHQIILNKKSENQNLNKKVSSQNSIETIDKSSELKRKKAPQLSSVEIKNIVKKKKGKKAKFKFFWVIGIIGIIGIILISDNLSNSVFFKSNSLIENKQVRKAEVIIEESIKLTKISGKESEKKNDSIIRIDDGYTQTQETIKPTQKEFGSNNNTTSLGNFNEQVLIKKEISGAIIIGSFRAKVNAEKIKQTLLNEGFVNVGISKVGSVNRVSILVSGSKEEAQEVLKKVKVNHKSAWINYN